MSSLIVPVTHISKVRAHPNADRLEIAEVLGWQVVVGKGQHKDDDRVVFIPPDAVLPQEVSDRLNVTKYLAKDRVHCVKLRGVPSYGLVVPLDDPGWEEGTNVADHYKVTKYIPPVRTTAEDAEEDHPAFHKYTDMENLRNFPDVFTPGEEVVAVEKLDGTNCRTGLVEGTFMAGSHGLRRKPAVEPLKPGQVSLYWLPLDLKNYPYAVNVRRLLTEMAKDPPPVPVVLFGEVFGPKVQDFNYGRKMVDFCAFDISYNGMYLDYDDFAIICDQYGVPTAPVVYRGPFDMAILRKLADEKSSVGGDRYREGVVVRPVKERRQMFNGTVQRVILKLKGDLYLTGGHTDYKDS